MDVLSDVLLAVRLTGAVFFDIDARSPFVAQSPPTEAIASKVAAEAEHVIAFHVLMSGSCWVEAVDDPEPAQLLKAGEMVIFPDGDANILASAPGMRGQPDMALYHRPVIDALPFVINIDGDGDGDRNGDRDGAVCRIVCGYLACDERPFNPLLESLPRMVHAAVSPRSWQWMTGLLDAAIEASGSPDAGQEAMLAKLSELMFLEALRAHLASLPADARGWVAGLRDPEIGAALRVIHGRFAEPWTVELLAREVQMSRSSFVERFTTYVEVPPMTYLVRWRLQVAARMLQSGSSNVAQTANAVGYHSESAFHRAFKRQVGSAPGTWRRGSRGWNLPVAR
jgi:AraC-like DNA-binding protein